MVRTAFALFLILSVLSCFPVYGSQQIRPFAGIGLLIIRPFSTENAAENNPVTVYEVPAIKRVVELNTMDIPQLAPAAKASPGEYAIAVAGKKGDWLRIAYDDAGREGWIKMKRCWEYFPWNGFLKGRHAGLLPKLRESNYMLRKEPSDKSEPLATLSPSEHFRVTDVDGDWLHILVERLGTGWIRWRGEDGRFMITLGEINP